MIAIQAKAKSFSDRWIDYCKNNSIKYKLVDVYANDIIQQVSGCEAFMWHFHQADYRDMEFAKSLILSLESMGVKCFPDSRTCWHFDDKISQKYLLEAVDAPFVPSFVFYSKDDAVKWAKQAKYPKVFKLKGGAGATNVMMAQNKKEALSLIRRSFGKGFRQYRWRECLKEEYRKFKNGKNSVKDVIRPFWYAFKKYPTVFDHYHQREIGYVYFQEFIPNNTFDIRICVVGDKAFGLRRNCREHDFRASGGGDIHYARDLIDDRCVAIAFDVCDKLKSQCIAFDFVFSDNTPLIVEISYGFSVNAYDFCEGYWTRDNVWHPGSHFDFCGWMVANLIGE